MVSFPKKEPTAQMSFAATTLTVESPLGVKDPFGLLTIDQRASSQYSTSVLMPADWPTAQTARSPG
jgi:hypothetical protein